MTKKRPAKSARGVSASKGRKKSEAPSRTAETLAEKQREISVSEFFAKNRHLLGFDNPRKAVLTTVKEAVDNALDACEEAGILPEIHVEIEQLSEINETRYRVTIQDNGPGIVRKQIDNIFGKLLYGSKFHQLKMSRGQQGIGISAAGMYGLMTTGKPMVITSRSRKGRPAHHVELAMDTRKNRPEVTVDVETEDFPEHTGTHVSIEMEGRYTRGRTSVDEYLEQTAIANPHARITFRAPAKRNDEDENGEATLLPAEDRRAAVAQAQQEARTTKVGELMVFPRTVDELPPEPIEIKPHPKGVELGSLMQMMKRSEHAKLGGFLRNEFCRVGPGVAKTIVEGAGLTTQTWLKTVGHDESERLYQSIQRAKIMAPPLDCLAPIGPKQILAGLLKGVRAEFFTASMRPPAVYRGNPFQIEVGLAFGGELPKDSAARVIRFANRVPLLYQQSACALYKAVVETKWRNYGVSQGKSAAPEGPMVIMIHMASVWAPFTSESKEAIADYDEIGKEIRLALKECGRKLASYVRKRARIKRESQKRDIFTRYIGEVAKALHVIDPELDAARVRDDLEVVARHRTELADEMAAENGDMDALGALARDENTVILDELDEGGELRLETRDDEESRVRETRRKKMNGSRRSGASDDGFLFE